MEAWVELDGVQRRVGVTLRERTDGTIFYNLNATPEEREAFKAGRLVREIKHRGGPAEDLEQSLADDGLNVHLLGQDEGLPTRLPHPTPTPTLSCGWDQVDTSTPQRGAGRVS